MHSLADSLQDFDVDSGGAAIVPVIFDVATECEGCGLDTGDDIGDVVRENGRVDVDIIRVEDPGEAERGDDGRR